MGVLENQGGIGGTIAARLVGMAWALVTFLAVPVIAIEGTGALETLKRSASIFRERWGQQITGNLAIGGAVGLFGILPATLMIVAGVMVWSSAPFIGALLVIVGAIVLAVALLISKALSGIFGVALYRYATEGEAVGGFTAEELESAVKVKKGGAGPTRRPPSSPGGDGEGQRRGPPPRPTVRRGPPRRDARGGGLRLGALADHQLRLFSHLREERQSGWAVASLDATGRQRPLPTGDLGDGFRNFGLRMDELRGAASGATRSAAPGSRRWASDPTAAAIVPAHPRSLLAGRRARAPRRASPASV